MALRIQAVEPLGLFFKQPTPELYDAMGEASLAQLTFLSACPLSDVEKLPFGPKEALSAPK